MDPEITKQPIVIFFLRGREEEVDRLGFLFSSDRKYEHGGGSDSVNPGFISDFRRLICTPQRFEKSRGLAPKQRGCSTRYS